MASTVLYMSMTLDGFIAGPNETPDNGFGDGGDRLHESSAGWIGSEFSKARVASPTCATASNADPESGASR